MRSLAVAACSALLSLGCSETPPDLGFAVALAATFDGTVDDAALARVTLLRFHATGDEDYTEEVALGRAAQRTERITYKPKVASRALALDVVAIDGAGDAVAQGATSSITLAPPDTVLAEVTLSSVSTPLDLSAPLTDLSVEIEDMPRPDLWMPGCNGIFCDTFDDDASLVTPWTGINVYGATTMSQIELSAAQAVSLPHSAHVHMPALVDATDEGLWLFKRDLPITSGKIAIDFDVKVVQVPGAWSGYVNLVAFEARLQDDFYYVGGMTTVTAGKISFDYLVRYGDGAIDHPIGYATQQNDAWHHAHIEYEFGAAGHYKATYDNEVVVDEATRTWDFDTLPSALTVKLGAFAQHQTGELDVYFDNVVVR